MDTKALAIAADHLYVDCNFLADPPAFTCLARSEVFFNSDELGSRRAAASDSFPVHIWLQWL